MSTATLYVNNKGTIMHARNANFATCRGLSSANQDTQAIATMWYADSSYMNWIPSYGIYRTIMVMDISSIPANATITAATFNFQVTYTDGPSRTVHIVSSSKNPTSTPAAADFPLVGSTSFGSATFTTTGAYSITLNASGIAYIVGGGWLVLGFRDNQDLNNSTPTTYCQNMGIAGPTNATPAYWPNLVVTYTTPTSTVTPMVHMIQLTNII